MKKLVMLIGAVSVAVYGTFSLVRALQAPDEVASEREAPSGVVIAPAIAFVNTSLQAMIQGRRGASADPGACRWFVNGEEVAGATTATLEPGRFKKGDSVRVEIPAEGLASEPVVISNTPPRITSASADLQKEPSATIFLRIIAADADNDPITYRYEWLKNGKVVEGETGATIDVSHFKKGETIYASVVAFDGQDASSPTRSDPIKMGSNAPKITSTPPQELGDERRFVYQVTVAPGSGPVKYELVESPSGMSIDGQGRIEWTVPVHDAADAAREHKAVVRVTDPAGGYATQTFSITTSVQTSSASGE